MVHLTQPPWLRNVGSKGRVGLDGCEGEDGGIIVLTARVDAMIQVHTKGWRGVDNRGRQSD